MKAINVLAVFVVFLIGISAISVGISLYTEDEEVVILVHKLGMDMEMLNEPGYLVLEEYENFVLVRTPSSKGNLLMDQGYVVEKLENRGHVGLNSYAFDTLNGEPDIPEELMIQEYSRGETGYYILQFIGPIKTEWQEQVREMGVTLHEFRNRFNFIVEMDPAIRNDVEKLDFVNWIGVYQPAYKFDQSLLNQRGDVELEIHVFGNIQTLQTANDIEKFGGEVLFAFEDRVTVRVSTDTVPDIARIPYVNAIELSGFELEFFNNHATWITQTNIYDNRKVTDMGVTGVGEIVCVMDSELYMTGGGHEMWRDTDGNPVGDDHRKVQANYVPTGSTASLGSGVYHGTHVTGTVLGDAPPYDSYNNRDGNAMSARLIFQDIGTAAGGLSVPPDMYNEAYGRSYNEGARAHTNSWGGGIGAGYGASARTSDLFIWNHRDYNILYAMANSGSGSTTLSTQAEGKNVISVGAAVNYANQNNMASFSSRGYAVDGRIKPTVVHIGQGVTSASRSASGYSSMSGTSMSTPGMAGQVAQVRHYYEGGWYPSGSANAADGFNPSAALVRATIINGAVEMTGTGAYTNDNRFPNGDQGYGRSMLDRAMYFQGDARKLITYDSWGDDFALSTGETWTMDFTVEDTSQALEATLAWSDYRGPSGANPSNPAIVNDLDLELIAPDGTRYTGNAYTGFNPGHSQPDPTVNPWNGLRTGEFDGLNVEENILLLPGENDLQLGVYELRVSAHQVSEGTQPFAVVISGGVSQDVGEPPEVVLSRPDGGEVFDAGTSESITWSATPGDDPVDYIDLLYSVDAGSSWETIDTGLANTGSYSWIVPNEHSTECLVRVEAVDNEGRRGRDESNAHFTIIGTPPAAPGSVDVVHYGTVDEWEYLYNQPHRTTTDLATGLTGGGVFYGAMRKNIQADLIKEVAFYVRDQANYVQGYIYSDGAGGTNPGTRLGETAVVNNPGANEWVEIPLTEPLSIDGGYYWVVFEVEDPDADSRPLGRYDGHVDGNAWISLDGSTWNELRDFDLNYNHAIEVLTAEYDEEGTEHNLVTWDASSDDPGEVSHYNIHRAEDSDGPWNQGTLIHTTTADGSASYQYIDEGKGLADDIYWWYVVRAVGNNGLEEENTGSIQEPAEGDPPEITLTRPEYGEVFSAGDSESITWSATQGDNPIDYIDLHYSVDGGDSWQTIELELEDTGTYTWMVPDVHSTDCVVRARARDTAGRTGTDMSGAFTILGVPPAPPSGLSVVHYGEGTAVLFSDDVSQDKGYTTGISNTGSEWGIRSHGSTVGDNSWDFGDGEYFKTPSYGYLSWLISPEITIPAEAEDVELSFDHWRAFGRQTTYLDGGNLKISTAGVDGPFTLLTPDQGYDGAINDNYQNPLGGQQAWGGSASWETVTFDLTAYAGQSVHIRWDAGIEAYDQDMEAGWRIDNILVTAEGIPFEGDEDNLLTWNASPDDPGTVSHYNIYRSEAPEGPWDPVDSVDADGSPEYQYLDEGRGMADEIYWWYLVRAVGTNGAEEENVDAQQEPGAELTTMDIELFAGGDADGWNLVSFNLILANTNLETILADISGDYDKVMYYDAASGIWRSHIPGRPSHYNNLESWDRTMGVWIRTTEDTILTVEGARPDSTSVTLYPGWNLVGLPSETSGTHGIPVEVTRIGYFHASEEYNMAYTIDVSGFVFEPGKGYWVYNDAGVSVQWDIDY